MTAAAPRARVRRDQVAGELAKLRRDDNGFLHFEARAARVGVLSYADVGGPRELTTAEVLFDPASMATLVGMPVTDEHPPENLLDTVTAPVRQKGSVYAVRRDGEYLIAAGVITDAQLADEVERKQKVDISPGYRFESVNKTGTWTDGERFDSQQLVRRYNHLAIVPVGRCSRTCGGGDCKCAVRVDGQGAPMSTPKKKVKARLDGKMVTLSTEQVEALLEGKTPEEQAEFWKGVAMQEDGGGESETAVDGEGEGMGGESPASVDPPAPVRTDSATAQLARKQAEIDALKARVDALTDARTPRNEPMTDERLQVIDQVRGICGPGYQWAGKSVKQIRLDGLKEILPADKFEAVKAQGDIYVREYFAVQLDTNPLVQAARENGAGSRGDGFGAPAPVGDAGGEYAKVADMVKQVNGQAR